MASNKSLRLYGSLSAAAVTTVLLLATLSSTWALPLSSSSSSSSSHDFCRSRNDIQQLYHIGGDFYIAQSSSKVFKYDGAARRLAPKRTSNNELFGNKKFSWVDTVISLNGFCTGAHQALCEKNSTLKDLERLNVVIGSTKAHGYGFVLYESLPNADPATSAASLKQVTFKDGYLNEALSAIGLPLKASEEEAMIMDGEFWPKNAVTGNFYFKSGLYIPERGEVLFNGHPPKEVHAVKLLRGRFFFGQTKIQWTEMKVDIVPSGATGPATAGDSGEEGLFAGMFTANGRSYAVGKRNVYEMQFFDQEDRIVFRSVGSLKEMVDCYENSTLFSPATIVDKMAAPQEVISSTTSTTTVSPIKTSPFASTTETDVEIFVANPNAHVKNSAASGADASAASSSSENQSGEIKEEEMSENDLNNRNGAKNKGDTSSPKDVIGEGDDGGLDSQSDDPRTHLAGPTQLAHVNPKDDGLIWTFSILVGVLILLAIIILIPILIIRHNARSDRLYLNKKAKKSTVNGSAANGNSQNSEEVQLMNSSNIEK